MRISYLKYRILHALVDMFVIGFGMVGIVTIIYAATGAITGDLSQLTSTLNEARP